MLQLVLAVGMKHAGASIVVNIQGGTPMTNNNNLRKNFIMASMLAVGLAFFPHSTFAGGAGNHGSRNSENLSHVMDAVHYSQDEILQLNSKQLTYLENYRVNGFYEAMSSRLVTMLLSDHSSTQTLLQDMAKLDTWRSRKARLKSELQRVSALDAASGNGASRQSNIYRKGVKAWLRYPNEGTRRK